MTATRGEDPIRRLRTHRRHTHRRPGRGGLRARRSQHPLRVLPGLSRLSHGEQATSESESPAPVTLAARALHGSAESESVRSSNIWAKQGDSPPRSVQKRRSRRRGRSTAGVAAYANVARRVFDWVAGRVSWSALPSVSRLRVWSSSPWTSARWSPITSRPWRGMSGACSTARQSTSASP